LNDGRVVPNFLVQALSGKNLTVYGDGKQTRSFCYVDDLVDGILRVFCCDYHDPINLGNPQEVTILEFAEKIIRFLGLNVQIVFEPLPQDDPKTRKPDISRARELLSWAPEVPLDEGLRRTLQYFKLKCEL
jgi:dTDP-glucose 4,6-dehydratase